MCVRIALARRSAEADKRLNLSLSSKRSKRDSLMVAFVGLEK